MKKIFLIVITFLEFNYSLTSLASDFKISVINSEDKKVISSIFQKKESLWVPAEELKKYPGLYWQSDLQAQSFKITSLQKGMEDIYFVPIEADYENGTKSQKPWSQSLSILIINRKDSAILKLPDHPVLEWNFDHLVGVAFRDVQGNGKRSIIVDAAGATGMGANGSDPFDVIAVYLQSDNGTWRLDPELQKNIDDQMYKKCKKTSCRDIKTIVKFSESYFKKKK